MLIAGMQQWRDALQTSYNHTVGPRYSLNRKYLLSPVLSTDRLNMLGWILSLTLTVRSRIWMCPLLLPSLAIRPWSQRRRTNSTGIHTSTFFPFILETTGRPGPHARKFISYLMRYAGNPPLAVRDTWSTIQSVLHSAISKQQLTAAAT